MNFALNHMRGLAGLVLTATMLISGHNLVHHMLTEQAAEATLFDQLAKPVQANVAMVQPTPQPQWIPLSQALQ